jgi:NADH:ubiquinone oxidoreductase subunit 5 (subunit L)/multisubunit Na+/H+ antiporter MnhA subunit
MSILIFIYYFIAIYSKIYMKYHRTSNYFEIIFNIFFMSMAVFMVARNLMTTFIAWEFLRITSFLLISFYTLRIEASKSSIKALLMNKVGNITLIFALIYVTHIF